MAQADGPLTEYCEQMGRAARLAARKLALASGAKRDRFLHLAAQGLSASSNAIFKANEADLARAADFGLTAAQVDRLRLTPERIESMIDGLAQVAALPDPLGRTLAGRIRPNGLDIRKVSVPLGVILFIYESRPNVTVDAAALAVKSGNAIILRGGKEAVGTNQALYRVLRDAVEQADLPCDAVQFVDRSDRGVVSILLRMGEFIDLVIPRGGTGLIRTVADQATMPILKHYQGNCHIYVDRAADLEMAKEIVLNAKCQRPGVCNAAETLLIHAEVAETFLPDLARSLREKGVELRGCERTRNLLTNVRPATEEDFATEFLDLILAIRIVDDLDSAIEHIERYGSHHTDAIVTGDLSVARRFVESVDSAAVMVNASTRFHDGYEFGLGAEIGISTDRFHARGPCGLEELTTYKYVVYGTGQVRT